MLASDMSRSFLEQEVVQDHVHSVRDPEIGPKKISGELQGGNCVWWWTSREKIV